MRLILAILLLAAATIYAEGLRNMSGTNVNTLATGRVYVVTNEPVKFLVGNRGSNAVEIAGGVTTNLVVLGQNTNAITLVITNGAIKAVQ